MDKKKRAMIGVVVLSILILGYVGWKFYIARESPVVEASGTVEARTVELTAKVAGTIESLKVRAGEEVNKDDVIAEISRNDLLAQRERDALNVAIAQNQLNDLLSGARSQEIQEALALVNIQQVALEQSARDLERAQILFAEGSISKAELEGYEQKHIVALNQLQAAQAKFTLLQAGGREEQIKAAENQVKMMEAVLKATETVLADLKIVSPLTGTVLSTNYEVGEYVQAGASLATVADLRRVWINVYVPTDDLPYVKLGAKVQFTVSGLDKVFEGVVAEIASRGEFTPKTIQTKKERTNIVYKVRIEAANEEGFLKPGMPADVIIPKASLTAPSQEGEQQNTQPEQEAGSS
ncbi:MAG TPA: HlyD family efflux transporter periplasmic adaptor subunit [Peptococcaceae bacterium]|nr:HlyD family efflux transporter periplasmic adaptor subunit [Peptococcaceae bacterium]